LGPTPTSVETIAGRTSAPPDATDEELGEGGGVGFEPQAPTIMTRAARAAAVE
jgi:hypothetical protein